MPQRRIGQAAVQKSPNRPGKAASNCPRVNTVGMPASRAARSRGTWTCGPYAITRASGHTAAQAGIRSAVTPDRLDKSKMTHAIGPSDVGCGTVIVDRKTCPAASHAARTREANTKSPEMNQTIDGMEFSVTGTTARKGKRILPFDPRVPRRVGRYKPVEPNPS